MSVEARGSQAGMARGAPVGLRQAGGAPVMAVQDVRLPPCLQQELQCSLHSRPLHHRYEPLPDARYTTRIAHRQQYAAFSVPVHRCTAQMSNLCRLHVLGRGKV